MKRWSLRLRFLLLLITLLVLVFAAITLLIVRQNSKTLRTNLVNESKSFAALATQPIGDAFILYQDSGTIHIQQQVNRFIDLDPNINEVEIVDTTGKKLFSSSSHTSIKVSPAQASGIDRSYLHDQAGHLIGIVQPYLENSGIHRYNVVYGVSYESVNRSLNSIVAYIIILSVAILLFSLVTWYLLINYLFLRPVASISRLALLISRGDFNQQIHLRRNDEIGDLATAVDTMASSLKADIAKLQEVDKLKSEFLMITAHNLRTPLTIIKGYIENLKDLHPPAELQKFLDLIATNVTRLDNFSEDALTISTIEADQMHLPKEPVGMALLLSATAQEFEALAKQKRIHFTAQTETPAWVLLSKPYFHGILWNLLDNAYKFTPEDGTIELTTTTMPDRLEIAIKDSGIGIAASELPHLFTKFHRATDTLTYNYEGTGIGLYLSKLVVEQYGGGIKAESEEKKGSTFTIWLPTIPPPTKSH
jgi:signal transduction histidine kinase